jgi:hypothetical protein
LADLRVPHLFALKLADPKKPKAVSPKFQLNSTDGNISERDTIFLSLQQQFKQTSLEKSYRPWEKKFIQPIWG